MSLTPRGTESCSVELSASVSASDQPAPSGGCSLIGSGGHRCLRAGQMWVWLAPEPATTPSNEHTNKVSHRRKTKTKITLFSLKEDAVRALK